MHCNFQYLGYLGWCKISAINSEAESCLDHRIVSARSDTADADDDEASASEASGGKRLKASIFG